MIAVYSPLSGVTPEAMAKAMASGSATIPTVMPANKSFLKRKKVYFSLKQIHDFGMNSCQNFFTLFSVLFIDCLLEKLDRKLHYMLFAINCKIAFMITH